MVRQVRRGFTLIELLVVVAIIALAFLSFGIWVHHMFTVGIPHLALAFFSAGSAIVAVPMALRPWLGGIEVLRP